MSTPTTSGADGPEDRDRILLFLQDRQNQHLLQEWLDTFSEYEVLSPARPSDVSEFDICIVDWGSLWEMADEIERLRAEADPVFLPCLLAVPRGRGEGSGAVDRALTSDPRSLADDVVMLPVEKATFRRRVESLLEARRASRRLAERTEQYERLVALAPDAIMLVRDGRIVYANESAVSLCGASGADEIRDRAAADLIEADERETFRSFVDEIVAGRRPGFETFAFVADDRAPRLTQIAGVTVTYDGESAVQLIVRDVTAERDREERLTLYGEAIEAATQGITIADARQPDNPLIYANPAFERITGYEQGEFLGRNCRFLQGENTNPETVAEIRAALDAERSVSVEILNYRRDGTPFWNHLDIVPVRDADGAVTHFVGLQRDVTTRREREQRLSVLDRVLRHNLRNRLTVIRAHAERLGDGESDPRDAAEKIVAASDELLEISDKARQFRNVITSREHRVVEQDLSAVVRRSVEGFRAKYPTARIDLDAGTDIVVRANELLSLAFDELLLAVVKNTSEAHVEIVLSDSPDGATVEVTDHGGTIPEADLRMIDEEIERQDRHLQGVGLWLVRWAIDYSDADLRIEAESEPRRLLIRFGN